MSGTVEVEGRDGGIELYEAIPEVPSGRGVIVLQEIFGVTPHIEDVTRRFAALGYHAVAPHLFHRTGNPWFDYQGVGSIPNTREHIAPLSNDAILTDIDAAIARLNDAGIEDRSIGIVGFCFGGRATMLAAQNRPLGAAVSFYGGGMVTQSQRHPHPPLLAGVTHLQSPWLGFFGDLDPSIPVEEIERLRGVLVGAPVDTEIVRFADAGHGFHRDATDQYHEESAKIAWTQLNEWFDSRLA